MNQNKSLDKILEINKNLGYSSVSSILCQLLTAVNYLHDKNILHSFINTQTIYLQNNDLKLGGFYFCEKLESKDASGKIERILEYPEANIIKCPEYPIIGLKYDVWCIGRVLFELTGASDETKGTINIAKVPKEYRLLKKTLEM